MSRFSLHRSVTLSALCAVLAAGCSAPPVTPVATTGQQAAPTAPADAAPVQLATAGFTGSADINGAPLANAEVKVYRPGQDAPIAIAKTDENGRFAITLGSVIAPGGANVIAPGGANVIAPGGANVIAPGGANVIAPGGGNVIAPGGANVIAPGGGNVIAPGGGNVIAPGGGNVIAPGGGNVIAPGGGNVIAPGGGNVIAPGGGNVIAPGGGNVIAPGGGNVIAPGGANLLTLGAPLKVTASKDGASLAAVAVAGVIAPGGANVIAPGGANVVAAGGLNYRVAQADSADVHLTASTTLAVLALGDRLEGALKSAYKQDGGVVPEAVSTIVEAMATFTQSLSATLGASDQGTLVEAVTHALDANGHGTLPIAVQKQVAQAVKDFQSSFIAAAKKLGDGILKAIDAGGTSPDSSETTGFNFGGVNAPPVVPSKPGGSSGSNGSGGIVSNGSSLTLGGTLTAFNNYSGSGSGGSAPAVMDYSAFLWLGNTNDAKFGAAQVTQDGQTFTFGGYDYNGSKSDRIVRYTIGPGLAASPASAMPMNGTRAFAAATIASDGFNKYVYVVGGLGDEDGHQDEALDTVERAYASYLPSGVGFFSTEANYLYKGVFSPALVNVGSRLYVVGGATNASTNAPVASVQTATVQLGGALGIWNSDSEHDLDTARFGHVAFVSSGSNGKRYLYVIGGRTDTDSLESVEVAEIATNGDLVVNQVDHKAFHPAMAADPVTGQPDAVPLTLGAGRSRYGMKSFVRGNVFYVLGGLQMSGTSESPFTGADRATIDPVTGKLGRFVPHQAELANGRAYYNLILDANSPLYVTGGTGSETTFPALPASEKAPIH